MLGEYIPIAAQIACIYFAIVGNWNELFQSELREPDDTISVNSHMFHEIYKTRNSISSRESFRSKILDRFAADVDHINNTSGTDKVDSIPSSILGTLESNNHFLPFTPTESSIYA